MTNAELESLLASERIARVEAERKLAVALREHSRRCTEMEAAEAALRGAEPGDAVLGAVCQHCGKEHGIFCTAGDAALTQKEGQGAPAVESGGQPKAGAPTAPSSSTCCVHGRTNWQMCPHCVASFNGISGIAADKGEGRDP